MRGFLHFAIPLSLEILLLAATLACIYRAQKKRIYPAFWQLLTFWVAADCLMLFEGFARFLHLVSGPHAYEIYFFTYWPVFAITAILMLRVMHEMFRHAVRSIPGVQKLGRPIFFWAVIVSVVLAFTAAITPHASGMGLLIGCAQVLMRSESVMALCMLAFLAFASHALGVSFRSRIFGVIFGFGVMAASELAASAFFANQPNLASTVNLLQEVACLVAIALWASYFLQPEPVRKLVVMPATSPLMRWNDIAQTLGNSAGQVAVSYPPTFMKDVVDLVDRVMGPSSWPADAVVSRPPGPIAS